MPTILAIESSCDETAAAIVEGAHVRSSVVSSQIEVHRAFGGVVPELASRHHLRAVMPVMQQALAKAGLDDLSKVDAVAVTEGPGLVGALLVGVQAARGVALAAGKPLLGIHHMEGHLFSAILGDDRQPAQEFVPHVALLVSGGHTELAEVRGLGRYRLLGCTRDDAAGEAFDKVAKMLGLGYPGGPVIDKLAAEGDATRHRFPRAMLEQDNFDFSFSGLKTAMLVHVERHGQPKSRQELADLCAAFQAAVVDVLVEKSARAVAATGLRRLHVVGGVAANAGLRTRAEHAGRQAGYEVVVPPLRYCGDNAAMIAAAAEARFRAGALAEPDLHTSLPLDDPRMALT